MGQQTLPEDINRAEDFLKSKIGHFNPHHPFMESNVDYEDVINWLNEYYHLRDSEVEGLKKEINYWKEGIKAGSEMYAHLKFDDVEFTPYQLALQTIEQQAATIKELLEAGNRLMRHSNESPATSEYKDFYSAYDDFKQLLNKHKP